VVVCEWAVRIFFFCSSFSLPDAVKEQSVSCFVLLLISWSGSVAIEGASTDGKRRCTRILQSACA
jgi:hypothetical protein